MIRSYRVMFVCQGNICRSPLAHALFETRAREAGLAVEVESSGTSAYHVGEPSDRRMRSTAARRGVDINHRSRQFLPSDLTTYDLVLAMDGDNLRDIRRLKAPGDGEGTADVVLFRDFDPEGSGDVPDPWYGGPDGFELVFDIVDRTVGNLVREVQRRTGKT